MKLHIVTVGEPKLGYAKIGWSEYLKRLGRYHQVRVTHLADKYAYDAGHILQACGNAYKIGLIIEGKQLSSPELAAFLDKRAPEGKEACFVIGGPEGLPADVQNAMDLAWSFSKLTFPHDLAMVVLAEALYRASTISAGHPYHKA
ncbi:MAG TPA: 23S rRNA (pseudouridine(1915)-N(3))-methyltransferase RlmH [Candidatus Saccharimonadales bacterium]|nr:23S rRNA (pseudouridine(1915)-N(3))-methyltransferase RlmH [Candidatus Saccharimonadales bacterium]